MQLNPYSLWEITVFPSVLMVACLLWRSRRDFQGDGHNPWASQNRWEHSRLFCCSSRVGHQRPVMGTNSPRLCVLIQAAQTHPRDIMGWKDQEHHLSKMSTSLSCSLPASLPSPRVVKVKSESHWKEKENALYSLLSLPESTALVSFLQEGGDAGFQRRVWTEEKPDTKEKASKDVTNSPASFSGSCLSKHFKGEGFPSC